jgi:dolichol-phosphate mannosyltransferase
LNRDYYLYSLKMQIFTELLKFQELICLVIINILVTVENALMNWYYSQSANKLICMNPAVELSVVVPVYNERDNIVPLIDEIVSALEGFVAYEIVYVNDGSKDDTLEVLLDKQKTCKSLRVIKHATSCGQSTAVRTGVKQARAAWIATLDGDGQNVPADIPSMYDKAMSANSDDKVWLIAGWRKKRNDSWLKLKSSKYANAIRQWMLKDKTPDTGCGLKVFRRDIFLELPSFDHMHRYLPALYQRAGGQIETVEVQHRARERGVSKYGFHNRLWVGIVDLFGVSWLIRRGKLPEVSEVSCSEVNNSKDNS